MRRFAAGFFTAAIAVSNLACASAPPSSSLIPGFLIGTWRTDTESHADTFLRLTATTIAFGTLEGTIERHAVAYVTRTEDWFGPRYTIAYQNLDGDQYHLDVYFDDQTLRLSNRRQMAWKWSRF